jgi:hypothetical protein
MPCPDAPDRGRAALRLVGAGAALSLCVAVWALQGDQTPRVPSFLVLYAAAFAAYLAAVATSRDVTPGALRLCLLAAVAWRVALVAAPPLLSNDVHRSVYEGRVQNAGGNPYAWRFRAEVAPASLRDESWERMNHKRYTAIYPPLWQLAARAVTALWPSATAIKALVAACEVLSWWPLALLLRRRGLPRGRLLVAAWSPLALVEGAGSGHNDALAIALLVGALCALEAGRPALAALLGGLGAAAKLLPALVAAAWARRFRPWHLLVPLAVMAALLLPFRGAGPGLWRSLQDYGRYWRFNETGFALLAGIAGSHESAAAGAAGLLLALAAALAWRGVDAVGAAMALATAWIVLSPNVLPWYALWLVPLLALRDAPPLMALTALLPLAYLVYPAWLAGGEWRVGWGVRAAEYLPPLLLAGLAWRRRGAARPLA